MATESINSTFNPANFAVVDQVGIQDRVARVKARSIKKESKLHALKTILSMIDLTTLEGCDTPGKG